MSNRWAGAGGDLTAQEIWQAMNARHAKGLPQAGDQGLDNTDTWGRKYWAARCSACFADVENPQTHRQQIWPAGRHARRDRRRRQS